jgi:hypothetical protein
VFPAFVLLALGAVAAVIGVVVVTLRRDARAADARDARTEEWLAELDRRYDLQAAAQERAAEAMIAARHRSERRRRFREAN